MTDIIMNSFLSFVSQSRPIYLKVFLLAICGLIVSCGSHVEKVSIPFQEPDDPDSIPEHAWAGVKKGMHASFGSIDERYARSVPPSVETERTWSGTAWRGERV